MTAAILICACLFAGCASSQPPADSALAHSNPMSVTTEDNSGTTNNYADVLSLRTEGYQNLSLKDFNAAVKAQIEGNEDFLSAFSDFGGTLTPEDSDYSFYKTLSYSIDEVIFPQMGGSVSFTQYLKKHDGTYAGNEGETFYTFMFTALYSVEYRVIDEANLTVGERDELLDKYQTELQNAVSGMSNEKLQAQDIRGTLQSIADSLTKELSTDALAFENSEILSIEILDGDTEYQK